MTTEAAWQTLAAGGNAYDAALAGWLAGCLAEPVLTSPGGGGFAMVSPARGAVRLYDFFTQTPRERAPGAADRPYEADFGSTRQVFHLGAGSMATPGCVAGILQLHADLGELPLGECATPALEYARNGILITNPVERLFEVVRDLYKSTPASAALFGSGGEDGGFLKEGMRFRNPELANFIEQLVAEGARWFYEGDIGRLADSCSRAEGGHLRRDDFIKYRVEIREPLQTKHHGSTIWLNPPPSMGGTLIALGMALSENSGNTSSYPFRTASAWENWFEPLRLMTLLRSRAGFEEMSEADQSALAGALRKAPGLSPAFQQLFPRAFGRIRSLGTTQMSIMDADGNEISMTTSNGAGSGIILKDTGFMMNNMLGEDDLQPDGRDTWAPDTRLASMMAPTLVRLPNGTRVATGSGGSNRIRSTVLQILRHIVSRGASLEQAILAPRLHWEGGILHAETEAADALGQVENLEWPVVSHSVPNLYFGGAHSCLKEPDGQAQAIGDPRRGGSGQFN